MAYRKKFRIPGLKARRPFGDSLEPVLAHYFGRIRIRAVKYRDEKSMERLHDLRIALRRFRYALELYATLIKPRRFQDVYEIAVNLQNVLGERRDLDVMQSRLELIYRQAGSEFPAVIAADLERNRVILENKVQSVLTEFMENRSLQKIIGE